MKNRYKGLFTVSIYKDYDTEAQKTIDFPLTEEGTRQALDLAKEFLDWQRRKRMIKPFVVPEPSKEDCELGYSIVPKWVIDVLMAQNETIKHFVDCEGLIAVFEEMQRKGFLEYTDSEGEEP